MKNRIITIIPKAKLECFRLTPEEESSRHSKDESSGTKVVSLKNVGDGFVFSNLAGVGSVKLLNDYLDDESSKTHVDWRTYCAKRSDGIVVPNSIVLYQMARALYRLKDDNASKEDVEACLKLFKTDWTSKYPYTGTKIKYGRGLDAVVDSLQLNGLNKEINVEIPEFTKENNDWSYLTLATEQEESQLGNVNTIPENAIPILQELLGEGYETAGEIFQYLSPRKDNGNLREVKLWTPTIKNRNDERAVVLGINNNDNFNINANDNINNNRPAREWCYFPIFAVGYIMKTFNNLWKELCTFHHLINSYELAKKHKSGNPNVIFFEKDWQLNIAKLCKYLISKTYKPLPLKKFIIKDPKTRTICVSDFKDRILHHALVSILQPIFEPRFIHDSYASRKNKGTLKAIKRFDEFKRKVSKN